MTAAHCICTKSAPCLATEVNLEEARPGSVINVCIGVRHERNCRTEIKQHLNYVGIKAIIPEEKLSLAGKHNYDIALLKLDRDVVFGLDMSPICLDSKSHGRALDDGSPLTSTHNQEQNAVFISGFGITHYKKKKSSTHPECSTNHFLPRPFHSDTYIIKTTFTYVTSGCASECFTDKSPPSISKVADLCDWIIFHHQLLLDNNTDIIRVWLPDSHRFKDPKTHRYQYCFPNKNAFGWCHVDTTLSHADFDGMPRFGYCSPQCKHGYKR